VFYFSDDDVVRQRLIRMVTVLPPERWKIRNNVEATEKEFVCLMQNHKLKVRGYFHAVIFAFTTALVINFDNSELIYVFNK
jgi:hypothetical protein